MARSKQLLLEQGHINNSSLTTGNHQKVSLVTTDYKKEVKSDSNHAEVKQRFSSAAELICYLRIEQYVETALLRNRKH